MNRLRGSLLTSLLAAAFLSACGNVPVIRGIQPASARPGEVIEITGEAFGSAQGKGFVRFKAKDATNNGAETLVAPSDYLAWSSASVKLRVPPALTEGPYTVQLENDTGNPSNKKDFTVLSGSVTPGSTLVVANQSEPGLEIFDVVLDGTEYQAGEPIYSVSLAQDSATTRIRGLAAATGGERLYVTLVRRDNETDMETSALIVFGGVAGDVTAPTLVDVGVEPTGMALSPSGAQLFVAATASGLLSVVDTATNTVQSTLGLDLSAYSYGFEPLNVAAYASPSTAYGDTLVTVTGNNWFLARGEVITFAPGATAQTIVSHLILDDYRLTGPLGVSAPTGKVWVVGDHAGKPAIAMLDVTAGTLVDHSDFDQLDGYSGQATHVTDVLVDRVGARVWAALPGAGVAELPMAAGATQVTGAPLVMHAVTNPLRLTPLALDGLTFDAVLVTLPATNAVALIDATGLRADFATTLPSPSELLTYKAAPK